MVTRVAAWLTLVALITRFIPARAALGKLLLLRRRLLLTRRLDAAECAAQFLNLTFVGELLAFGHFDEFKHLVQLIHHAFEGFGDVRGVFDRLTDGRRFGRTKIGGLHPRLGTLRFRAAFGLARAQWLFTRTFGAFGTFRLRRGRMFLRIFRVRIFQRLGLVRGEFCRFFRVRRAEAAFVFRLVIFRRRMIHRLGGRGSGFNGFGRGRKVFGSRREVLGRARARAAATASATAATAGDGTAGSGRRIQIGMFVRHKISVRMAAGRVKAIAKCSLLDEQRDGSTEAVEKIFVADRPDFTVAEKTGNARRSEMRLQQFRIVAGATKQIFTSAIAAE